MPDATPPLAIDADALSRAFGARWAVRAVSIRLPPGRALLLAGHNGAGKTTLLRLLSGLLPPSAGSLRILGSDPHRDPLAARALISAVSHRGHAHLDLTAEENLVIALRLLGRGAAEAREHARKGLDGVGLLTRADDPVRTFSAGMKKRLSFARALAKDAPLVLLDEPYGQLDPQGFALVDALIERFRAEGRTVVVATHLVARAGPRLDTGMVMVDGELIWAGPARDTAAAMEREAA
jgi:heme exporter protein A